jgi:hypothetical protein
MVSFKYAVGQERRVVAFYRPRVAGSTSRVAADAPEVVDAGKQRKGC